MAGPDSFALDTSGKVVLQDAVQAGGPATQIGGGSSSAVPEAAGPQVMGTNWQGIAQTTFKTLDAVNKLADGVLKPYVERMEKQQYYDGMSKVVQGQTLQQIEKDDPWYMNIFGPSATVRGAQAMTATTALTQAETEFLGGMEELREQSPEQVRKYLVDQATRIGSTGDPLVDATVQSKLAESWGPMLRTHMKEHVAWQQADMLEKQVNLNLSNGENLKSRRKANSVGWDAEDRDAAFNSVIQAAMPAFGQSRDSWNRGMVQSLQANLNAGNFDFYNAIKASPLWSQIDGKAREQLDAMLPQYVMKDAQSNPAITGITNNMAGFEFNIAHGTSGLSSEAEVNAVIDGYNAKHQEQTGAAEPLVNNTKRAALLKQWMAGQERMQAAAAKIQAGEAQYVDSGNFAMTAFTTGNYASMKGLDLDAKAVADSMNATFDSEVGSGDPARIGRYFQRAAQASFEPKLIAPKLQQFMTTNLNGLVTGSGPVTPQQQQALTYAGLLYKSPNGPEALSNYVGATDAAKIIGLLNSGVDVSDPKALIGQRELIARGGAAVASEAERKVVRQVVMRADPGWLRKLWPFGDDGQLGPYGLSDRAKEALAKDIEGEAAQRARAYNLPIETAARLSLNARLENADLVAGAVIKADPSVQGDRSLAAAVHRLLPGAGAQSTSIYQESVREVIRSKLTEKVRMAGGDMSNFDAADWEVVSGSQIGHGMLTLFLYPKDESKAVAHGVQMLTIDPQTVAATIDRNTKQQGTRDPANTGPVRSPTLDPRGFEEGRRQKMIEAGIIKP